jgi:hypothetical protein
MPELAPVTTIILFSKDINYIFSQKYKKTIITYFQRI